MKERSTPTIKPSLKATPTTTDTPDAPATVEKTSADPPSRHDQIAIEAYLLAARRGFTPGQEIEDWLAAETLVEGRLRERSTRQPDG